MLVNSYETEHRSPGEDLPNCPGRSLLDIRIGSRLHDFRADGHQPGALLQ
jgi:hypothetical protein